jgi:hypothetical protein
MNPKLKSPNMIDQIPMLNDTAAVTRGAGTLKGARPRTI